MIASGVCRTILVADDEPDLLRLMAKLLRERGYTVLDASDAWKALRMAHAHSGQIDLLLTDLIMPGMDGTALAHHLCLSQPGLRVIYISGCLEEGKAPISVHGECALFLPKPFPLNHLLCAVNGVMNAPRPCSQSCEMRQWPYLCRGSDAHR